MKTTTRMLILCSVNVVINERIIPRYKWDNMWDMIS